VISFNIPAPIRKVYDQYKDLFDDCDLNYKSATNLISLFAFCFKTLSDFVRAFPGSYSVSSLSRDVQDFKPNRFIRRMQKSILRKYKGEFNSDDFAFAIDDTANPKYGDGIFRNFPFRSSSGHYHGQKILALVLVDIKRNIAIPISYAFLTGKKDPHHIPAPSVALRLLKEALVVGFPCLPVLTDSWFDSVDFIREIKGMNLKFCGEIKSNRLVRNNPGPRVPWSHLQSLFKEKSRSRLTSRKSQKRRREKRGKSFSELILYLKNLGSPLNIVAVYNRMNGINAFAYYATTDLTMSGEKLWQYSRARWSIECLFRDLKQNLSFGCIPCEGEPGADLAVCIPFMLITSIRLDSSAVWKIDKLITIGKMLSQLKEDALSTSIDFLIHNPNHEKVSIFKARRSNVRAKPTNLCGKDSLDKCA
jgi:Transposase DDE domain